MSDNPIVKISSPDSGESLQWAKGAFYRKDGGKHIIKRKSFKFSIIFFLALTSFSLLFVSPNSQQSSVGAYSFSLPEVRQDESSLNGSEVDKNLFKSQEDQRRRYSKLEKRITVSKLGVISRHSVSLISPGAMLKAKLITGGSNGMVKAVAVNGYFADGEEVIRPGSIFIGKGKSGKKRLYMSFETLVDKGMKSVQIKADAYDFKDKVRGIKGTQVGRVATKIAATTGLHFIGGMSGALQKTNVKNGLPINKANMRNALLNGASSATLAQANEMMKDVRSRQSFIEVPEGTYFYLVFQN